MSEKLPNRKADLCADCPRRSMISRALAGLIGHRTAEGCEGSVVVARGRITTQTRRGSEPTPPEHTWTSVIGSISPDGEYRYSRTDWQIQKKCGREDLVLAADEVPCGEPFTAPDGQRHVAFIAGNEQQLRDQQTMRAIIDLHDM